MAKAPLVGAAKTRLVPPLTPEEAANLHVCFLRDMSASIANVVVRKCAEGVVVYEELFLSRRRDDNYPAPHTREYLATLIESRRIFPKLAGRTTI